MPWREHTAELAPKLKLESLQRLYLTMVEGKASMIVSGYGEGEYDDQVDLAVAMIDLTSSEKEIMDALDALAEYVLIARNSLEEFYKQAKVEKAP